MKIMPAFAAFSAATMCLAQMASGTDLLSTKDDPDTYRRQSAFLEEAHSYLPPVWGGFYLGAHIGGVSGQSDVTDRFEYYYDPSATNDFKLSGTLAGVQAGYMIETTDGLVFGIEAAIGHMNADGHLTDDDLRGPGDAIPRIGANYAFSGDFYGELTGRIGIASDDVLLYLKGGRAFLDTHFKASYEGENWTTLGYCYSNSCGVSPNHSVFSFEDSDTLFGWTVGAGLEFALSDQLTARLEYQHYDFGTISYDYYGEYEIIGGGQSQLRGKLDADVTLDVVKFGINYKVRNDRRALH